MRVLTPASPIAILSYSCTTIWKLAIDSILATSAKALALDDQLAEAHASRGLALSLGKRYEEATAEFERAIALDPNSFEAHYFYARACVTQGKLERAATLFERAAENKPDDYQSLCLLIRDLPVTGPRSEIERVPHDAALNAQRVNSPFTRKIRGRLISALTLWLRSARRIARGNGRREPWPSTLMMS